MLHFVLLLLQSFCLEVEFLIPCRTQRSAWSLGGMKGIAGCQATAGTFSPSHQNPFKAPQDNRDPDLDLVHGTALRIPPRSPFCPSNQAGWRIPWTEASLQWPPIFKQTRASNAGLSLPMASPIKKYKCDGINEWDSDSCENLWFNCSCELKDANNGLNGKEATWRRENTTEGLLQAGYGTDWFKFTSTHITNIVTHRICM